MRGVMPLLYNTPSWHGVRLKHREKLYLFYLYLSRERNYQEDEKLI